MPVDGTDAALAALSYWAAGDAAVSAPAPEIDLARRAAWLLLGADPPPDGPWPALPQGPLASVFGRLRASGGRPAPLHRPLSLRLEREALFPVAGPPASLEGDAARRLAAAVADLQRRDLPATTRLEALLFALQRHAWSLPSPLEGVSRYDFARSNAALAAALAGDPASELCLIGGDLSGVQDFIYSVTAQGAARQLRGRSLYLQLLTDACAQHVLHATGMPLCNLLYAGGGRFYVLAPAGAEERLPELRRRIGAVLARAHHGALYLALGAARFPPAAYGPEVWRQVNEAMNHDKRRRFAALEAADFQRLFEPRQPPPAAATAEDEPLDVMGASLEGLGRALQRASFLSLQPVAPHQPRDGDLDYGRTLAALGLSARLYADVAGYRPDPAAGRRLLALNDELPLEALRPGPRDVVGLRYTAAEAPLVTAEDVAGADRAASDDEEVREGQIKPFNLLAAQSEGVHRLGVLRMDVDDLGALFGAGLDRPEGLGALALTAALSAALARFFEGWVGQLCRQINAGGRGGVYAIYSGGDDLFLVGAWDLMPALAQRIRADFAAYVLGRPLEPGESPPITLSAGLVLVGARYPLYQAADDAARALEQAKHFTRADGRGKDAITFLGRTLGWEQFDEAAAWCEELRGMVAAGAPRALLMTIQRLDAAARQGRPRTRAGAEQFAYGPWVWQGAYQLARMAERSANHIRNQVADLRERLVGAAAVQARAIERAGLAARWAQLLLMERERG